MVPPPVCKVKVIPNVNPSVDSWVISDTDENNAGYVRKTDIPKKTAVPRRIKTFVK